ncbi:glycoside hydrolase family 15 protein [Cellulomonas sp. ATA003]|uniref:glycoside hydrolase family 15 protein n=1 Tax=Cellulomonas sp. ATA003 TaxID=3073064 RepID=UPI0028737BBA|nr:glycoside hydrolase family 15 protein [Cellulomonas sp. ATA003]WNB87036.1 glycoside hydrolase family 15 protein [Cellulomonas sp. ATA003]
MTPPEPTTSSSPVHGTADSAHPSPAEDPVVGSDVVADTTDGGGGPQPEPDDAPAGPGPITPIGDYAVLGDRQTAALVSRSGSVDWLCLPSFDSSACFAALLGTAEHGRWLLTVSDATEVTRRYLDDSFVLQTTYVTPTGRAVVTECMPMEDDRADMVRRVEVVEGHVMVEHEWIVRFGYGKVRPWVHRVRDPDDTPGIRATAGPDSLLLRGDRLPTAVADAHRDTFRMDAGQTLELVITWTPSWAPVPRRLPILDRIHATEAAWSDWAARRRHRGSHAEAVDRSLLVLRLLTDNVTGGIVAAATTSLPEDMGGERNWDYRYCWLRDAALTLEALLEYGYREEATEWRNWLLRAVAGDPADLQIMYGIDGRRELPERTLDHLPGYGGSRPVRVGNAAVDQVQHDVLGEVMCALDLARAAGLDEQAPSWELQRTLVDHLADRWREPDRGIWEVRGDLQHFTHSKVMAWAALDRAVRAVEVYGLDGPDVDHWRAEREAVRADVLTHGFDAERNTFVQAYGDSDVDASLLQIAQVGFLPADDPRFVGTVDAIRAELEVSDGLVHRYRTHTTDDGLAGGEHPFLACSFWLADALARMGRTEESGPMLDRLIGLGNDLGLLAEEYDVEAGRMMGNLPQALSHLALVRAVYSHDEAVRRRRERDGSGPRADVAEEPEDTHALQR